MRNLLSFFLILIVLVSTAQEGNLKLSSKRNSDKSIDIEYEKMEAGSSTVILKFKELSNSSLRNTVFTVNGFSGNIVTLQPINKDQSITYSYTYRYVRGKLNPKISKDFVYALPYPVSTEVAVREAGFLRSKYFGSKQPEDWKVFYLVTKEQSVVTASRKGLVLQVENDKEEIDEERVSYSSESNKIIIEHEDGTLAMYSGFAKGSINVKVGETVIPGQELGRNMKRGNNQYAISFSVYYLKNVDQIFEENKNVTTAESYYGWVNPLFITNAGNINLEGKQKYEVQLSDEIIQKELSKRELKKLGK